MAQRQSGRKQAKTGRPSCKRRRESAAVAPLGGSGGNAYVLAESQIPIWNFYNDGDTADLVKSNREFRTKLIKLGASPLVTEYHQNNHDCWNRAYREQSLFSWLLEQSLDRNVADRKHPFHFIPTQKILADWKVSGTGQWTGFRETARIARLTMDSRSSVISGCGLKAITRPFPNVAATIAGVSVIVPR